MKTLIEYINEKSESVFVVRDNENNIMGLSEIEDDAKAEADIYNKELPLAKAVVKREKKSDYIKED